MITAEQFDAVAGQFDFLQRADATAAKEFKQAVAFAHLPSGKRLFSEGDPLRITHQEIAAELGTSREVISRILEDLAGAGMVRSTRGKIEILDVAPLEILANP